MVDAVLDYIRMLFHIDLIKFNSMLEMAEKNRGKIEEVIQIIGYLDSMISAASFRTFLPYYEKPNFTEGKLSLIHIWDFPKQTVHRRRQLIFVNGLSRGFRKQCVRQV